MRIASISKPITMAVVAKLVEEGKLNLDAPVNEYVPDWPTETVDGKEVKFASESPSNSFLCMPQSIEVIYEHCTGL